MTSAGPCLSVSCCPPCLAKPAHPGLSSFHSPRCLFTGAVWSPKSLLPRSCVGEIFCLERGRLLTLNFPQLSPIKWPWVLGMYGLRASRHLSHLSPDTALIQAVSITAAGSSGHGKQAAVRCFRVSLMNSWGKRITLSVTGPGGECEHSCLDSLVSVNPLVLHKTVSGGVPLTRGGGGGDCGTR